MTRPMILSIVLAWIPLLSAVADSSKPTNTWLRGSGANLEIRLSGRVLDAHGDAVSDPRISVTLRSSKTTSTFDASIDDGQYGVWLPVNQNPLQSLTVTATEEAAEHVALQTIPVHDLRRLASTELTLRLAPPERIVEISVTDDGEPVAGAHLAVTLISGLQSVRITGTEGTAEVPLYESDRIRSLAAWTDDRRVGGFSMDKMPDPGTESFECELHPARTQTVRLVDGNNRPVAGVPINLQVATPPPDFNYIGPFEHARQTTNRHGEAVFEWFPDWEEVHCYVELLNDSWMLVGDLQWSAGIATQVVQPSVPRRLVEGRVLAVGVNAAGVNVRHSSFQHPQRGASEDQVSFADAEGRFWFNALPNATYVSYIHDSRLVSDTIDWIPLPDGKGTAEQLQLKAAIGTPAFARVTSGDDREPIADALVLFQSHHEFSFQLDGRLRVGSLGRTIALRTDASGRAGVHVPPGLLRVIARHARWSLSEERDVISGDTVLVHLHREQREPQTVQGELVIADGADAALAGIKVRAVGLDDESAEMIEVTVDKNGRFAFATRASTFGVYARTSDGKAAGLALGRDAKSLLRVTLLPTVDFRGQLLDQDGEPIANHRVTAKRSTELSTRNVSPSGSSFYIGEFAAETDERGYYTLENLPSHLPLTIHTYPPNDPAGEQTLRSIYLDPSDARPLAVDRVHGTASLLSTSAKRTLHEQFEFVLRDCRLGGYHLMVIRAGDSPAASRFAENYLLQYEHQKEVARYLPLQVTVATGLSEADASCADEKAWPPVDSGQVFVAVYDQTGCEIARTTFDSGEPAAIERAREFVAAHVPRVVNAAREWEEAFAEAKATHRKVWAIHGGRYCGPCFQLSRWIDEHRQWLNQDYVFLKVDPVSDEGGEEIVEKITRGERHGTPFHVIFDSDQTALIDSAGVTGNIGMPSGFEGRRHLKRMLDKTRQRLSDEQIGQLIESLPEG